MSNRVLRAVVIATSALGLAGLPACEPHSGGGGGAATAVVDMERLFRELGRDQMVGQAMQAQDAQLREQLAQVEQQLRGRIEEEQKKIQGAPTLEQQNQILRLRTEASQQMQGTMAAADELARRYQAMLLGQFREEVRPIAEQVAAQRNVVLVLSKDANILAADPSIDLTEDIKAVLEGQPPMVPLPPPTLASLQEGQPTDEHGHMHGPPGPQGPIVPTMPGSQGTPAPSPQDAPQDPGAAASPPASDNPPPPQP